MEDKNFVGNFPSTDQFASSLAKEKGSTMWMFAISSKFVGRAYAYVYLMVERDGIFRYRTPIPLEIGISSNLDTPSTM